MLERLEYVEDKSALGTAYHFRNGTVDSIGPYKSAFTRRTRPVSAVGDKHTPLDYDHVSSTLSGFDTSRTYNRYWNGRDGKFDTILWSGHDIPWLPPHPSASMADLPLTIAGPGYGTAFPTVMSPILHPAYGNLSNSVLSRLRDNKMELGTELAELRETSSYLARRSSDLFRGLLEIKKGNVFRGINKAVGNVRSKRSDRVASAWLESQYAIKPLIYTVSDAFRLSQEGLSNELLVSARDERTGISARHKWTGNTNNTILSNHWEAESTVDLYLKLTARVVDPDLVAASQLGLDNPYGVAWELVPFSFVLDWVLPVGDFLNAFYGPKGLTFLGGYASIKARVNGKYSYQYDATRSGGRGYLSRYDRAASFSGEGYKRTAFDTFPRVQLPRFENMISRNNVLSALALVKLLTSKSS